MNAKSTVVKIAAALYRLVDARHTGRVVITVDFHEGGVRTARTALLAREEAIDTGK